MTPICGINRGETLSRYQFGHKILGYNKYVKGKLVRSWKALPDLKIYIGTLKLKNTTQKSGLKCSSLKPDQKISRLKKLQ